MKIKLLLCLLVLYPTLIFTQSVDVDYGVNGFFIDIKNEEIIFKRGSIVESVKLKDCSRNLFNDFKERYDFSKVALPLSVEGGEFIPVIYKINGQQGRLNPDHPFAIKVLGMMKNFEVFKLATDYRCEMK